MYKSKSNRCYLCDQNRILFRCSKCKKSNCIDHFNDVTKINVCDECHKKDSKNDKKIKKNDKK